DIRQAMVRYLQGRIDKTGVFVDEEGEPADSFSAAVALLALYKSGIPGDDPACGKALEALLRLSGYMGQLPAKGRKLTALETVWLGRAILAAGGGPKQRLLYFVPQLSRELLDRQALRGGSPDEIGAIRIADGTASTGTTGAAMVFLRQAKRVLKPGSESLKRLGKSLPAGRAFCLQMMYQPAEAYFVAKPIEWTGAVRVYPGGKRISLAACAAAIEAMLDE
ncbi:MAG: hypothetical protein K8S55_11935, partial [Phycisphaerae bacterium]|nr:hypothetical protein [Phycisphaerae bacterium]